MAGPLVEVIEYTDSVCSWAWGTEPKLRMLRWRHGVPKVPLLAGLKETSRWFQRSDTRNHV